MTETKVHLRVGKRYPCGVDKRWKSQTITSVHNPDSVTCKRCLNTLGGRDKCHRRLRFVREFHKRLRKAGYHFDVMGPDFIVKRAEHEQIIAVELADFLDGQIRDD